MKTDEFQLGAYHLRTPFRQKIQMLIPDQVLILSLIEQITHNAASYFPRFSDSMKLQNYFLLSFFFLLSILYLKVLEWLSIKMYI